ncbi:MAG: hypothetical protein FWF71_04525 [Actinomycetia bacterium]|nr:hypothetical protein [Actinomycetes bacterium]
MSTSLQESLAALLNKGDTSQVATAIKLQKTWQTVAADTVLDHSDNIIFDKKNPAIVVIFVDDSRWAAELNAEKEIYRVQLSQAMGLVDESQLQEVRFAVSRKAGLKKLCRSSQKRSEDEPYVQPLPLSAEEEGYAREIVSRIVDEKLRISLFKAMKANLEWKKGIEALKKP